jgi:hypothetical protein
MPARRGVRERTACISALSRCERAMSSCARGPCLSAPRHGGAAAQGRQRACSSATTWSMSRERSRSIASTCARAPRQRRVMRPPDGLRRFATRGSARSLRGDMLPARGCVGGAPRGHTRSTSSSFTARAPRRRTTSSVRLPSAISDTLRSRNSPPRPASAPRPPGVSSARSGCLESAALRLAAAGACWRLVVSDPSSISASDTLRSRYSRSCPCLPPAGTVPGSPAARPGEPADPGSPDISRWCQDVIRTKRSLSSASWESPAVMLTAHPLRMT